MTEDSTSKNLTYEEVFKLFYHAALKAIAETGDAYKKLSWFNKHKQREQGPRV